MRVPFLLGIGALLLSGGSLAFLPPYFAVTYEPGISGAAGLLAAPGTPRVVHLRVPEPLKAIYMSQCAVGTLSLRESLVKLIEETELNAVVIDVRDYTGKISFSTDNPVLKDSVSEECGARDMKQFIERLHSKDIFVIARITTFQNPYYTKLHPDQAVQKKGGGVWKDYKGLAFVDVGAKPYWEEVVALGKEAYALGFDELNFDYVRFPSDGPMSETHYSWSLSKSKEEVLEEFFKYLSENLRPMDSTGSPQAGPVLSADLFGMVATNENDLNIGQILERALPYFDYIYPMVYPSHYPVGFNGYRDVNAHPYDIVEFSMRRAAERAVATSTKVAAFTHTPVASTSPQLYAKPAYNKGKLRPWLQSFDYPVTYTPEMVRAQIQATYDAGLSSWIFWDAANKYRSLRQVLVK